MKLATVRFPDGHQQVVVVDVDRMSFGLLSQRFGSLPNAATEDMVAAISALSSEDTPPTASGTVYSLSEVQLLAPIGRPPRNIICIGKNYREHARELSRTGYAGVSSDEDIPADPIVFTKPWTSISGPADDIPLWPGLAGAIDYEAELAVIIKTGGRNIRPEQAMNHVFGYTIINDVTARDLQQTHKQWFLGKAVDGFAPMGPWIVTAEEVGSIDLTIECRVNGDIRQKASTADPT